MPDFPGQPCAKAGIQGQDLGRRLGPRFRGDEPNKKRFKLISR